MEKILFFDDEEFLSGLLIKNLRNNFQLNITSVSGIEPFLKEIENVSIVYSLFIMDIMAPLPIEVIAKNKFTPEEIKEMDDGMNTGFVLAKKIWALQKYKDAHIIFLSARDIEIPKEYEHLSTCFRKPEKASVIANKINEILK